MQTKSNNIKILIECVKAFGLGALIGFGIKYLSGSDSYRMVFVLGFFFLGMHARNNSYLKNNNKLEN
jgi:F0F1-type ATP synthase assembly protein I